MGTDLGFMIRRLRVRFGTRRKFVIFRPYVPVRIPVTDWYARPLPLP